MTVHLADAVGELLRQRTLRIHYLPGAPERFYTARAPGLLVQLAEEVGNSSGGHGARTVPGSRIPLGADALDLWTAILTSVHTWADHLGVPRRQTEAPRLLKAVAAAAVAKPDHDDVARTMRRRCWCGRDDISPSDCTGCWVHRIEGLLLPALADRELRGVGCWECKTGRMDAVSGTEVMEPTTTVEELRDGERYRVPAVVVRVAVLPTDTPGGAGISKIATTGFDNTLWVYRMCRACGAEGWLDYTTSTAA